MKAKCINFKKGDKTKTASYFIYMDDINKIKLSFDSFHNYVYLFLNDNYAGYMFEDDFDNNISDFIYKNTLNDVYDFNFTDVEFYKHFNNVKINWLKDKCIFN